MAPDVSALERVPKVDLSLLDKGPESRRSAIEAIGDSLRVFGFLTVSGHGVETALIDRAGEAFARFFAQDAEQKSRVGGSRGGARGHTPFGREVAVGGSQPDLKEFFHVGQELTTGYPVAGVYPQNIWPSSVPELRAAALELFVALERCTCRLLEALAEYFELAPDVFVSMIKDGNHVLRAVHYPPVPPGAHPDALRAAAHQDINLITLLCGSTADGLELLTRDGRWLAIDSPADQIIVDAGDMLARVTNDVVPATTHRVTNGSDTRCARFSLPFFAHPYPSCDLSVLPSFVSSETPPRYPPITAGEFLDQRLREIGLL